jgi:hypothetical protein
MPSDKQIFKRVLEHITLREIQHKKLKKEIVEIKKSSRQCIEEVICPSRWDWDEETDTFSMPKNLR